MLKLFWRGLFLTKLFQISWDAMCHICVAPRIKQIGPTKLCGSMHMLDLSSCRKVISMTFEFEYWKIIILSKDFKPLCFQVNFVFFLYALFHLSQSFEIYLSQIGLFLSFFCFSHICHTHLHQYFLKRLQELKSRILLLHQLFYFM